MALRYAIANGNWSDVTTWDGGTTLPENGDTVYANGKTIEINQNIDIGGSNNYVVASGALIIGCAYEIVSNGTSDFTEIGAIENTVGTQFISTSTTYTGDGVLKTAAMISSRVSPVSVFDGMFNLGSAYVLTLSIWGGRAQYTMTVNPGNYNFIFNGNIYGSNDVSSYRYAVFINNNGNNIINGNIYGFNSKTVIINSCSTLHLPLTATGTLVVNGNVYSGYSPGTKNYDLNYSIYLLNNTVSLTVNGNVYGLHLPASGTYTQGFTGSIFKSGGTGDVIINGDVVAAQTTSNYQAATLRISGVCNLYVYGDVYCTKSNTTMTTSAGGNAISIEGQNDVLIDGSIIGNLLSTVQSVGLYVNNSTSPISINIHITGDLISNNQGCIYIEPSSHVKNLTIDGELTGTNINYGNKFNYTLDIGQMDSNGILHIGGSLNAAQKVLNIGSYFFGTFEHTQLVYNGSSSNYSNKGPLLYITMSNNVGSVVLNGNIVGGINATTNYGIEYVGGNLTINGSVKPGESLTSYSSHGIKMTGCYTNSILTINGDVIGSSSSRTSNAPAAIGSDGSNSSYTASMIINGDVIGGSMVTNGRAFDLYIFSKLTVTINGDVIGNKSPALDQFHTVKKVIINGDVISSTEASGFNKTGITFIIEVNGSLFPKDNFPAIETSNTVTLIMNGTFNYSVNGTPGATFKFMKWKNVPTTNQKITLPINDMTDMFSFISDSSLTTDVGGLMPNESDVRKDVAYGPLDVYIGTSVIPTPNHVASGVPIDDTVGTFTGGGGATIDVEEITDAISTVFASEINRINNTATLDSVGAQLISVLTT